MRPILTPEEMRELDRKTIEDAGLPGIVLMELAAHGVMLEIDGMLGGDTAGARVVVFCGPGNNGGDGYAVGRRLLNAGAEVTVYLLADRKRIKGDALTNLNVYEKLGGGVIEVTDRESLRDIETPEIIVDALLGTGMKGAAEGLIADAIETINSLHAPVVAVDIASGVSGATGRIDGTAVRADITATFGEIKIGHIIQPGLDHAGRISRIDIQIPPAFVDEIDPGMYFVEADDLFEMLPERPLDTHKGDAGKVLVVAGSVGMTGAAELTARASLRSGAGLVKVATGRHAQEIIASRSAEIMTIPVAETKNGTISPEAESTIDEARGWANVEVIGPGISLNPDTVAWFEEHVRDLPLPTVIDADGLNALALLPESLSVLNPKVILTPHIGEFARLTGLGIEEIAGDRVEKVRQYAKKWNVTLLLKGVPTLIAGPGGKVYAVLAGNPGMASAGMGDVLTGIIAGLLAQGLLPEAAAIAGTSIHGLAGDLAATELGSTGIIAGDLIEQLPRAQDIIAGRAAYPKAEVGRGCVCGGGLYEDGCAGGD